jgi:FkbM family methyltransferase
MIRDIAREFVPPVLVRALRRWMPARNARSGSPEDQELARLSALPSGQPTTTEIFGWPFYVPDCRSFVHLYDLYFRKRVFDFTSRDHNLYVIDCGANIGVTVSWWKKRYPDAQVLAFEADPDIFQVLQKNCGALPGVRLLNAAVWDKEGQIPFVAKGGEGGHIAELSNRPQRETIRTVPCLRLRSFLSHKCDFLKIDIEGAEVAVIRDCADALQNVARIFVEYHSFVETKQSLGETISLLENAGFRLHVHTELPAPQPFLERQVINEKDLRLDLFGFRDDTKPRHDVVMLPEIA